MTTTPDLSGRIALVTGASRGIGYNTAKQLAAAGAHVIAVARTVGGLEELDDEIKAAGGQATLVPLDLTDEYLQWEANMNDVRGKAEVIVAKQRHGPTGTVSLGFQGEFTRFFDLAPEHHLPDRFGEE